VNSNSKPQCALRPGKKNWKSILMTAAMTAVAALLLLRPVDSQAQTTTAVLSCNPCSTVSDMVAAANSQYTTLPNGSIALMTSLNEPVSAFLRLACSPPGKGSGCEWVAITASNTDAAALDNQTFARASKMAPLTTPSNITYDETDEIIIGYIQTQIVGTGQTGISLWHNLPNFQPTAWYTMVDAQTGQTENIYIGDTITVNYPGGYSEQWQFLGLEAGSIQWKRVPNTLMQNGKPVTPPSSTPATPAPGHGALTGNDIYIPGKLGLVSQMHYCYGVSSVSIELTDGTSITGYGAYIYPC
jgi:hypothetical protein